MKLIDAEPLEEIFRLRMAQCSNDYGSLAGAISGCLKLVQTQPTISFPPNPPLTLEELREMGQSGLAVWCVDADGIAQGLLCMRENWSDSRITPHIWMLDDECNSGVYSVEYMLELGAKFYRRKPEEGTV